MKMVTKLKDTFEGTGETKGFVFTKQFENDKGYVYKVQNGGIEYFESFYKRETAVCLDFVKKIFSETDKKEVYPKSNDFGVWAWTTKTLKDAISYLN